MSAGMECNHEHGVLSRPAIIVLLPFGILASCLKEDSPASCPNISIKFSKSLYFPSSLLSLSEGSHISQVICSLMVGSQILYIYVLTCVNVFVFFLTHWDQSGSQCHTDGKISVRVFFGLLGTLSFWDLLSLELVIVLCVQRTLFQTNQSVGYFCRSLKS